MSKVQTKFEPKASFFKRLIQCFDSYALKMEANISVSSLAIFYVILAMFFFGSMGLWANLLYRSNIGII